MGKKRFEIGQVWLGRSDQDDLAGIDFTFEIVGKLYLNGSPRFIALKWLPGTEAEENHNGYIAIWREDGHAFEDDCTFGFYAVEKLRRKPLYASPD